MFVDAHAHLDFYENLSEVMERNKDIIIVSNGVNPEGNRKTLAIAKKYDNVKVALGFYPDHVKDYSDEQFAEELAFIKKNKPIAIGEVGLDYGYVEDEKQRQRMRDWFVQLINLSKELDVPITVHSRKAEADAIELLEKHGAKKVIMHCFCGKKKLVERIIKNGWFLTIPCTVVYAQQFQDNVLAAPITQLLTETDSPYLAPVKEEKNEPRNVKASIKKIAELKGMTEDDVQKNIFMNYQKLFL